MLQSRSSRQSTAAIGNGNVKKCINGARSADVSGGSDVKMGKYPELGQLVLQRLSGVFAVMEGDVGADARLKKGPVTLKTKTYQVSGVGHLCLLKMNAMLGLMKMETIVVAPTERDVPLFNLDWVGVLGKDTQIAELYDTQLAAYPQEALDAFAKIKEGDADLPAPEAQGAHWYDDILYPCSYQKTGKGIGARLNTAAGEYVETYVSQLESAAPCDSAAKRAKVSAFAETLFSHGGPAVDTIKRLFGTETAKRLILCHMYGGCGTGKAD